MKRTRPLSRLYRQLWASCTSLCSLARGSFSLALPENCDQSFCLALPSTVQFMYCDLSQQNRNNLSLCVQRFFVAFSLEIKCYPLLLCITIWLWLTGHWTVSFFCQLASVFVAAGFLKDKLLLMVQYLRYYLRSVEFWRVGCCQERKFSHILTVCGSLAQLLRLKSGFNLELVFLIFL